MRLPIETFRRIVTVLGALFVAFTFPVFAQVIHEDPGHGFVIEIPDGWHPVPEDFLLEFSKMVSGQTGRVNYVAGFQQKPFAAELERPYFLVQVLPFQDLGIERPLTDDEAEEFVEILTGLDGVEMLESTDSEYIQSTVESVTASEKPAYDPATRAFTYTLDTEVQGVGIVRGAARGMLGTRAMVQTIFYALKDDWDTEQAQAKETLASFTLKPGFAHGDADTALPVPGAVRASGEVDEPLWRRVLGGSASGALIGTVIGALVALVIGGAIAIIKRAQKTPADSEQPPNGG